MKTLTLLLLLAPGGSQVAAPDEPFVPAAPDFDTELASGEPRFHFYEVVEPRQRVFQVFDHDQAGQRMTWSFAQNLAGERRLILQLDNLVDEAREDLLLGAAAEDKSQVALFLSELAYLPPFHIQTEELEDGLYRTKERVLWNLRGVDNLRRLAVFRRARVGRFDDEGELSLTLDADQRQALLWFVYHHVDGGQAGYGEWWETVQAQLDPDLPYLELPSSEGLWFEENEGPEGESEVELRIHVDRTFPEYNVVVRSRAGSTRLEIHMEDELLRLPPGSSTVAGLQLAFFTEAGEQQLESIEVPGDDGAFIAWEVSALDLLGVCASPGVEVHVTDGLDSILPLFLDAREREAIRWFVHYKLDGGAELEGAWWRAVGKRTIAGLRAFPPQLDLEATLEEGGPRFEFLSETEEMERSLLGVNDGVHEPDSSDDSFGVGILYSESELGNAYLSLVMDRGPLDLGGNVAQEDLRLEARLPDGTNLRLDGPVSAVGLVLAPRELLLLSEAVEVRAISEQETLHFRLSAEARHAFRWFVYHHVPGGRKLAYEHWQQAYWRS